jgi:hypothetical protein
VAVYQHRLNKLKLIIRSALVGLIYDKIMHSPNIAHDNGASITLMSTDVDTIDGIAEIAHETWAQVLEVAIGIILLAGEVGWIWPLPIFLIFCMFRASFLSHPMLIFGSVLPYEPLRCETPASSSKGLEQCNTNPRGGYKLHAKFDESH